MDGYERHERAQRHSTLAYALACLADPATLAAIVILLLNDHVFKVIIPSWLTGKLSDVAGLYFFPFLVLAGLGLLELILPFRLRFMGCRVAPHRTMGGALALSGLWFLALKASPISNRYAIALLNTLTGRANHVIADPTDLVALAMLPLVWRRWRALARRWPSP